MTVPATPRRAGPYSGNGVATSFSFSFKTFAAADLLVTRTDTLGIETTLVLNSDYSVSLNVDQDASPGGTITYPISGSPLASGFKLTITGDLEYEQTTDLLGGGAFNARVIEDTFDRTVIQIQQLEERLDRALQVPVSSTASSLLPNPEANELIGWNSGGTALENIPLASLNTAVAFANMRYSTFTGNGVTTTFVLTVNPVTLGNTDVAISGVTQVPGVDYNLVGTSLIFTSAPANGTAILVRYGEALPQGSEVGAAATAVAAAATASAEALVATTQAALATAAKVDAEAAEVAAQTAQAAAEAARDAAQLSAGVYASTAAGLAATTSGQYFSVPSADNTEYLILYLNNSGAASEVKRYPSVYALSAIRQIDFGPAAVITDEAGLKVFEVTRTGGMRTKNTILEGEFETRSGSEVVFDGLGNLNTNNAYVGEVSGSPGYLWAVTDNDGNAILAVDSQGRLVANFDLVVHPEAGGGGGGDTTIRVYDYSVNQVFGYGQSLSVGQTETALSTTQNYDNLMFTRGMRPQYDYPSESASQWYAALVPAVEAISPTLPGTLAETTMVGIGDMIKQRILAEDNKSYTQHQYQMLLSTPGYGATTISQLSKGGPHFARMVDQATYGKSLSNAAGKTHAVQAVTWTQGESDYLAGTARGTYVVLLNSLIADINTDIKAVTGQTKNIPMISYQIASHKYYGGQTNTTANPYIALAQSDVLASNPLYYIACPMYQFTYWAGGHIVAQSTRWLGAYYGLAYKRIVINQENWQPLKPIAGVRQSNFVEVRFHVPQGPIVFDTTQVPAQTDYGFQLVDSSNNQLTITGVTIIDVDRIRITSDTTIPVGSKVRYGWRGTSSIVGMGNLRDSQGDTITFDAITATKRMDNWCLIFELEV